MMTATIMNSADNYNYSNDATNRDYDDNEVEDEQKVMMTGSSLCSEDSEDHYDNDNHDNYDDVNDDKDEDNAEYNDNYDDDVDSG